MEQRQPPCVAQEIALSASVLKLGLIQQTIVILSKVPTKYGRRWTGSISVAQGYNHDLASTDSSRGVGDGCPMYFVNSSALGWSCDP